MNQSITNNEIAIKLGEPFPFESVEAKVQVVKNERGMAVFYLDSRAIQKRLDEAVGALNWENTYSTWQDKAQICGISIFNKELGKWVTKHDGAENSEIEAIKGGLTDAFKRAAVLWGIGRYLYQIEGVWVDIEMRGKSAYIKDNQLPKLKAAYDAAVKKIFGTVANQQTASQNTANATTKTGTDAAKKETPPAAATTKPASGGKQAAPAQQAAPTQQAAPVQQAAPIQQATTAQKTAENTQQPAPQTPVGEQTPETAVPPALDFKIHSMKEAGKGSYLLELCDVDGELTTAYVKMGDQNIAVGAQLRNVTMVVKTHNYKNYNVISGYTHAAAA